MESLFIITLLTSGYYLSQNKKNREVNNKNLINQNNEDMNLDKVNEIELNKNSINRMKASDPKNTNVIPPNMNDKILNENKYENSSKIFSSLTGTTMDEDDFKHNNMVPFFKGSTAPGSLQKNNQQLLERFIGNNPFVCEKKEREPLFAPEKELSNIYGYTKNTDELKGRMNVTNIRNNETPFEKQIVGPGLNQGYTTTPCGGYHPDDREYKMPKTVDELRVLTNPKITYAGDIIQGKATNDMRGLEGDIEKHRPDTFYVNSPDRWNTTVGAFTKETKRPCVLIKETNRKKSRLFYGHAKSDYDRHKLKPKFKKSTKNIFTKDWIRNVYADDKWNNVEDNDYGKSGYDLPCNERDVTTNRTHTLNPQSIVKALISPLLDEMRTTKKENVIGNIRQSGNVQITGPSNSRVYDPNDVARTTMKETNIDNDHMGNVGNIQESNAYLVTDKNAPNTNRQFTEKLRKPTQVKEMLAAGSDKLEVDIKKRNEDYLSQVEPKLDKVYNSIPETNPCEITNQKDQLNNNILSDRVNSCMVDAFKKNPFTKSLNSY